MMTGYLNRVWGNLSLPIKGTVILSFPIGALLLNSVLIYVFASEQRREESWVIHTLNVQITLQHILADLAAVSLDCRIYKLTRDSNTLLEAHRSADAVLAGIDAVQSLTADNLKQWPHLPPLRSAAQRRLQSLLRTSVIDGELPIAEETLSQSSLGEVLELIHRMDQEEAFLLPIRTRKLGATQNREVLTGAIGCFTGVVSAIAGIWLFLTGIARRTANLGQQVLLLADGIPLQRTDLHSDEIGTVSRGLASASQLLLKREQALRESNTMVEETALLGERRFKSLVHASAQVVWMADAGGCIQADSSELRALTGMSSQVLVDDGWREAIHPEDRSRVQSLWSHALTDGQPYAVEYRLRTADGTYRGFFTRGVPVVEQNGQICEWICTATDVTQTRHATAMNGRLAAIVESSDDAIFSITLDEEIASWNKGAATIFGYSAEEAVGRSLRLLTPGNSSDADLNTECMRTGEAIKNCDVLRRCKDGTRITVSLTLAPLYDDTGRINGASGIARDVTDERHSEEMLQMQADLLELAYEPIIATKRSGWIVYWNRGAEELYGVPSERAVGRNIHNLLQTKQPPSLREIEEKLTQEQVWIGELERVTHSGQTITVESRQKLIRHPDGRSLVLEGDHDITQRRQAENAMLQMNKTLEDRVAERTHQLAEANEELESFCSSVSHDLRAPLRGVEGFAKILARDYGSALDERAMDLMRRMCAATGRMGQLIEDLLKLSRFSRAEVHRQSADLSALAAAVLADLSASQPERQVVIQVEPGVTAEADPRLLRVVLENLLGNAWKFTGKSAAPQIAFGVLGVDGHDVSYYVRDNGDGFDMAFADKLFVPFQRLHSSAEFEGTGVGLATVQRVIHRHHGRIWADSVPGQGTTFSFTLGRSSTE